MQVKPERIPQHLARRGLAPAYLLAGDEPLLRLEAADAIRASAREQGFDERRVLYAQTGFDWSELAAAGDSLSLFATRRIIEVQLSGKGPGTDGGAALKAYAEDPPADTLLLVHAGRLDSKQRKSAWFRAIDTAGVSVYAWPLTAAQAADWVAARAARAGLRLDDEALAVLATRTEGNLLAAAQEIERLNLLFPDGRVDAAGIRAATADSARFDIFDLSAKALAADAPGVLRSLERLREEGVDPVPLAWALVQDIRVLALAARQGLDKTLGNRPLPPVKKQQLASAQKRLGGRELRRLLAAAARLDRINKGAQAGQAWPELITLALGIAGVRAPAGGRWYPARTG